MVLLDRSSTAFGWLLFRVEHERRRRWCSPRRHVRRRRAALGGLRRRADRRRVHHHELCAEGAARDDARLSAQHLLWNAALVDAVRLHCCEAFVSPALRLELAAAHTSIASTASPAALFPGCSAPDLLGRDQLPRTRSSEVGSEPAYLTCASNDRTVPSKSSTCTQWPVWSRSTVHRPEERAARASARSRSFTSNTFERAPMIR